MANNTLYCTNNRLFPTKFLSSTFGISNLVSHTLTIAAPLLAEVENPYPSIVFVIFCIGGIVATMFL